MVNAQTMLAKVQATFIKNEPVTRELELNTHSKLGGQRARTLRRFLFIRANGKCVCCGQVTNINVDAAAPNAATMGLLIPAALISNTDIRAGYCPGNTALFCRMCINLSNNPITGKPLWIWKANMVTAENVPLNWPKLPKDKTRRVFEESIVDARSWRRACLRAMANKGIAPLPR